MNPRPSISPDEVIARALLYEGYSLYPYRASTIKNRHRWTIGGLTPGSSLRAECIISSDRPTALSIRVRFLHMLVRTDGDATRQEASEREIEIPDILLDESLIECTETFAFPTYRSGGSLQHAIEGNVDISTTRVAARLHRVSVHLHNLTQLEADASHDDAALRSFASAHVALRVRGGKFISLTDPPDDLRALACECRNDGVWPVLVGDPNRRDAMLASPIILPDFPRIAPESTGEFFDGTEIDEMLALRVLTLTDAEKREMTVDGRTKDILDRVEALSTNGMLELHGAVRSIRVSPDPQPGDRVRLRPRGRADAFDLLLAGKLATVVSIEEDFEGTVYVAVTVDDDPGRDLGESGKPGHRFFYRPDEIELLRDEDVP